MRLFIGIELDDEVRSQAGALADGVRAAVEKAAPGLAARWVPPANLHITLWFIGDVSDQRGASIADVLGLSPFPTAPFELELGGAGVFPPHGPPRVIWIGVGRGAAELTALHQETGRRLAPLGFEPERRPYSAHLTIARVKDPGLGTAKAVREALAPVHGRLTSRVAAVTLFRSRLSPRGAVYEPLLRVPLS